MALEYFIDVESKRILDERPLQYSSRAMGIHVLDIPPHDIHNEKNVCVLVHGFTQTGYSWEPLVEGPNGLRDAGYRSICLDLRGHGQSVWAHDADYSREAMVADILGVVDTLGLESFFLFGLSLGGALTTKFSADHPERVRALVIVDWAPWPDGKPTKGIHRIASLFSLRWDSFDEAVDMMHAANPRRSKENIASRMKQQLREAEDGWRWGTDPAIEKDGLLRAKESPEIMWNVIKKVSMPTLLLRGSVSDVLPQSQAELLVRTLQDGRLVVVPDAGHSVVGDNPAESIRAIMPFLGANHETKSLSRL